MKVTRTVMISMIIHADDEKTKTIVKEGDEIKIRNQGVKNQENESDISTFFIATLYRIH